MTNTIHQDFITAAQNYPEQTAVWSEKGSVSYQDLDHYSSAFAQWLINNELAPSHRVAITLPKSIDAIVAILGTLKAGNTYVPLGSSWASNRINTILENGDFSVLLIEKENSEISTDINKRLYTTSQQWQNIINEQLNSNIIMPSVTDQDLAYILYTSGSTGIPKGVCVSHSAAHYFPDWAKKEFKINQHDRIASIAPFTFDLSTFDLFTSLASGATIYLVPEKLKLLPSRLSLFLEKHAITTMYAVPSTLNLMTLRGQLTDRDFRQLKTILFAGEVFTPPAYREFVALMPKHIQYYNLYGPTETNVCTYYKMPAEYNQDTAIPIGLPLPGMQLFILPDEDNIKNKNTGELCVAGHTVMSGYWGKDNNNAPYWASVPENNKLKAYRTGDIVTLGKDGNWLYHGRRDKMVKIWGYRVELGEIETCLLKHPHVEQAAVIKYLRKDQLGEELRAFVVIKEEHDFNEKSLINHCQNNLTHFMVPKNIFQLDEMPINQSGKVDRLQLETIT